MVSAFQIIAALIVGVGCYMLAVITTSYDGVVSLLFAPLAGAVITLMAIAVLLLVGFPIRRIGSWRRWWLRHRWIPLVLGSVAFVMMAASWLPQFRVQIQDPELGMVDSFHPLSGFGGWLLALFAVLHFQPPLPWSRVPQQQPPASPAGGKPRNEAGRPPRGQGRESDPAG